MAQGGQVFVNFGANTQGLLAGTARAGNILQKFSQTGMGAAVVLGASFVTLSRTMTNFVTESISGFKDFDFQITRAGALSGSTTEEFKKMRDVAAELGRVTEWTALAASEGMANLALAGFSANEIVQMIPESLRLATAGGVDLAKTNTIMANAMRSFSLEADQANEVSNVLTATFTTTNTTLESLSQTIKNAAGVLGTVGVKIEEVSAAAGVLGDVGILASVAGTGLKNYGIKLAKTFGIMKDATKSAKEYFEALGVTKDRMFDAETGTFDMVEATIAFKEAMDKLGKAKAPEFLAQFSTLFGERAAVSLTALVRKAEQFKIQAENVRMTEMIGDVQQVFEQLRGLGGETAYMNNIQEGLNNSLGSMVEKLDAADMYMEEFQNDGIGAAGVIDRLSKSFKDTQKIMENTFGKKLFSNTTDGLMEINEYSKNGAVSMVKLNDVLKEMDSVPTGSKRRKELDEERKALEESVVSGKKNVSQLTDQGRARLINLASLREYIAGLKQSKDGTSKSANQLDALNNVFKGNAQNVAMAARAFGIHISNNDKLKPSLQSVGKEMEKMSKSTEAQEYSLKRLTSQVALTNTTMDMQAIQLNTLDGVIEIFKSGLEQISNNIAQALAPALGAATKTITNFMQVLTMNSDEIERGISVSDKLGTAWQDTIQIFTSGESVFARIKTGFEGLSSIGKNLAVAMGVLGVTGIAAGGAFVWVQALLPALGALSSAFFSIVVPVTALVAAAVAVGYAFKNAYEQAKMLGDVSSKSVGEIVKAYNSAESVVKGVKSKITELDAQIIKNLSTVKESIKSIKEQFGSFMNPLEKIAGLTNTISVTGGKLTIFGKADDGALVMVNTLTTINKLMEDLGTVSDEQKLKIRAAIKSGDSSMINKLLKETPVLMDSITEAGMRMTIFRKDQDVKSTQFQKDLKEMEIILNGLQLTSLKSGEAFKEALNSKNIEQVNSILQSTPELMNKLKEAGINTNLFDPKINSNIDSINNAIYKLQEKMLDIKSLSGEDKKALANAFKTNNVVELNRILQKTPELMNQLKKMGIKKIFDSDVNNNIKLVNSNINLLKQRLSDIKDISKEDKEALEKALNSNNVVELNKILQKTPELMNQIKSMNIDTALFDPKTNNNISSVNENLNKLKSALGDLKLISEEEKVALMKAFETNNIEEVNKILSKNKDLIGIIAREELKLGFATENQQKRTKDLNATIQGRKELLEKVNKELEAEKGKNDSNIDSQNQINALKKDAEKLESEINGFISDRASLQEDIITGQGKVGKLTNSEVESLKELQKAINQRSQSVGELRMKQEHLLKLRKSGVNVDKQLTDNSIKLNREHSLLVENQLKYNKILNDSTSLNPFTVLMRAMREISKTKAVKDAIMELTNLVSDFSKYIATELLPRISSVTKKFFSIFKSSSAGTLIPIIRLIRSVGGLVGDVVKYGLDAIGSLFDYIKSDSNSVFSKTANGINKLIATVEIIRTKVKPFMQFVGSMLIELYIIIGKIISKIGPPIVSLVKSLSKLFLSVFGAVGKALKDVLETKGASSLDMLAAIILYVSNLINKMSVWISNMPIERVEGLAKAFIGVYIALKLISGLNSMLNGVIDTFISTQNRAIALNNTLNNFKKTAVGSTLIDSFNSIKNLIDKNIRKTLLWTSAQKALNQTMAAGSVAGLGIGSGIGSGFGKARKQLSKVGGSGKIGKLLNYDVGLGIGSGFGKARQQLSKVGGSGKIGKILNYDIGKKIGKNANPLKLWENAFNGAWLKLGLMSERLGKVGSKGGTAGKLLGALVAPLTMSTGFLASISGMLAAIPALLSGILVAAAPIAAAIAVIGILVAGAIKAFKDDTNGFRTNLTAFIQSIMGWITKIAAKGEELFEKIMSLFDMAGGGSSTFIADLLNYAIAFIKKITDFVFGFIDDILSAIGGLVDMVRGIMSGNGQLFLSGLFDFSQAVIQLAIKTISFIIGMLAQIWSSLTGSSISFVKWLVDLLLGAVGKIPGLGKILGLDENGGTKAAIDSVFDKMKSTVDSVPKAIENAEKSLQGAVGNTFDEARTAIGIKTKAEQEAEAQAKRLQKIADKKQKEEAKKKADEEAKKKAEEEDIKKQAEQEAFYQQQIQKQIDATNKNTDSNKELSSQLGRPNVTNNTYVEYRAAEDDEVNRRMIERVMNDILKADIGLMMGDTAGMSTD